MRRGVLSPSTTARATKEEHGGHIKVLQEHLNWYDTCKRKMVSTKKATLNDMTATTLQTDQQTTHTSWLLLILVPYKLSPALIYNNGRASRKENWCQEVARVATTSDFEIGSPSQGKHLAKRVTRCLHYV
jgi:hypothetical protein